MDVTSVQGVHTGTKVEERILDRKSDADIKNEPKPAMWILAGWKPLEAAKPTRQQQLEGARRQPCCGHAALGKALRIHRLPTGSLPPSYLLSRGCTPSWK